MFQFLLLFLEIILLGATAYIYWSTRKLVTTSSPPVLPHSNEGTAGESQMELAEMARNLTELLAELQAATHTAHCNLTAQGDSLQQLLNQAETAVANLQPLIGRAEALGGPAVADHQEDQTQSDIADKASLTVESVLTLDKALFVFRDDLSNSGYGRYTITWITAYTCRFLNWLYGDNWADLPLNQVDAVKVKDYLNHLESQDCHADVLERTQIALKSFMTWADDWFKAHHKAVPQSKNGSSNQPVQPTSQANTLLGTNRYQAVLALAEQGLDRPTIAAQTGLEQEAVRLLLTMESPSLVNH